MALHILGLVLLSLLLTWPLFLHGAPDLSHDGFHHARWAREFATQFWHGDWFPRWFSNVNGGFGGPSGFFYPPLGNFVAALFWPLVASHQKAGWLAAGFSMILGEALSGISAYFWLRSITKPIAAFLGAAIYLFAPYHLVVDLYMRGALAELWTFVWFPLVLLSAQKLVEGSRWAIAGLALSFALAILSHPTMALCFAPIPLACVLFFSATGERTGNTALLIASLLLGVGLSAVYLVPALMDQSKANTAYYHSTSDEMLWLVQDWSQLQDMVHYLRGAHPKDMGASNWNVAFRTRILGLALSELTIVGLLFVINRRCEGERRLRLATVFWTSAALLYFFLMTNLSLLVWKLVPVLKLLQYPFRLNAVLVVCIAALFALAASHLRQRRARVFSSCLFVVLACWMAVDLGSFRHTFSASNKALPGRLEMFRQYVRTRIDPPEMWPLPGNEKALSSFNTEDFSTFDFLVASHPPKTVRFAGRHWSGESRVENWQPRRVVIKVDALQDSLLTVNHFYYAGWQAHIEGTAEELAVRPTADGLIEFAVPKGSYDVILELPRDAAERAGITISLLSLLLVGGAALWAWRDRKRMNLIAANPQSP